MALRRLGALVVVQERSFRGAVDRLGYVSSAVSQPVAQLERHVPGARLVNRSPGHRPPVGLRERVGLLEPSAHIRARLGAAQSRCRGPLRARRVGTHSMRLVLVAVEITERHVYGPSKRHATALA